MASGWARASSRSCWSEYLSALAAICESLSLRSSAVLNSLLRSSETPAATRESIWFWDSACCWLPSGEQPRTQLESTRTRTIDQDERRRAHQEDPAVDAAVPEPASSGEVDVPGPERIAAVALAAPQPARVVAARDAGGAVVGAAGEVNSLAGAAGTGKAVSVEGGASTHPDPGLPGRSVDVSRGRRLAGPAADTTCGDLRGSLRCGYAF